MRILRVVAITAALSLAPPAGLTAADDVLFGPMAPARVSGEMTFLESISEGQVEELGELMVRTVGTAETYAVSSADPRLSGTATATTDGIGWYPPALVAMAETRWVIEDGQGTWSGSSLHVASIADEDPINADQQVLLQGAGANEGLSAFLIIDTGAETFIGAIIPEEMPELPADWMEIYQSSQAGRSHSSRSRAASRSCSPSA